LLSLWFFNIYFVKWGLCNYNKFVVVFIKKEIKENIVAEIISFEELVMQKVDYLFNDIEDKDFAVKLIEDYYDQMLNSKDRSYSRIKNLCQLIKQVNSRDNDIISRESDKGNVEQHLLPIEFDNIIYPFLPVKGQKEVLGGWIDYISSKCPDRYWEIQTIKEPTLIRDILFNLQRESKDNLIDMVIILSREYQQCNNISHVASSSWKKFNKAIEDEKPNLSFFPMIIAQKNNQYKKVNETFYHCAPAFFLRGLELAAYNIYESSKQQSISKGRSMQETVNEEVAKYHNIFHERMKNQIKSYAKENRKRSEELIVFG
jgi:hypothetical protein